MNNIKKKLRHEINNIEIDKNILTDVKKCCNLEEKHSKNLKKYLFITLPVLASIVLMFFVCLPFFKNPKKQTDENTYITVSYESTMSIQTFSNQESPIIEIVLDKDDNIVNERGLNKSGVVVVSDNKQQNTNLEQVLENIILKSNKLGFLEGKKVEVIVLNNSKIKITQMEQKLNVSLENIFNTNLIEISFNINPEKEENKYGINPNLYKIITNLQKIKGGKIEDYLDEDIDDILEMLYDYDFKMLSSLENQIKTEIQKIEEKYEDLLDFYENIIKNCEKMMNSIENLIEDYENNTNIILIEANKNSLIISLNIFLTQFQNVDIFDGKIYFGDIKISEIGNYLDYDNIETFYDLFEEECEKLEKLFEEFEDKIEEEIDNLKIQFINF